MRKAERGTRRKGTEHRHVMTVIVLGGMLAAGAAGVCLVPTRVAPTLGCRLVPAPFTEAIEARGEIATLRFVDVRAPTSPYERQLIYLCPEGTEVKAGAVLARFDPAPLLLHLDALDEQRRELLMKIEETDAEWDGRIFDQKVLADASRENLTLSGIRRQSLRYEPRLRRTRGRIEFNQVRREVQAARTRTDGARRRKDTKLETKARQLEWLDNRIARANEALSEYTVRAPVDSLVVYPPILTGDTVRKVALGDTLSRGRSFMHLPDFGALVVRVHLEEAEVNRLVEGGHVRFVTHADRAHAFDGTILSIARYAGRGTYRRHKQFFEVLAGITAHARMADARPGMVVNATFVLAEYDDVLAVPRDFVFGEGAERSMLLRLPDGSRQAVRLEEPVETRDYWLIAALPAGTGLTRADWTGGVDVVYGGQLP